MRLRVVGCARRRLPEWKLPAGEPHTCLCVATAVPEDMRGDTSPSGGPSPSVLPDPPRAGGLWPLSWGALWPVSFYSCFNQRVYS